MTSIAKLKDKARKHEQKEDWQAAIKAYQQVLEKEEGADDFDLELGLYNRIGDLHLRLGHTDNAVSYYEKAADKYAESGFYNNAIALCNKALRHRPDRPGIYLKLSGLCAEQGFHTDARRWILEYAERQMRTGRIEEALTGLEDFAALSNDPEVRETLARQLAAHGRDEEAVEELRQAYHLRVQRGEHDAAATVAGRAAEIDPGVDLASEEPPPPPEPEEGPAGEEERAATEADEGGGALEIEHTAAGAEPATATGGGLEGLETRPEEPAETEPAEIQGLEGLESTAIEEPAAAEEPPAEEDLGELETFDDARPEPDEETPEPLPLLETGFDEEESEEEEEESEPLPLLETEAEEESEEEDEEEPLDLDLGSLGGDLQTTEATATEPLEEEAVPAAGEEPVQEEEPVQAEGADAAAVLQRSRELAGRGLTAEALRELRALSTMDADRATYREALAIVDEAIRHDPNDLDALQRRVEYAGQIGDRPLQVEAFTDLGDALARLGAEAKAYAIYERVLALDPGNEAAREALGSLAPDEEDAVDLNAVLEEEEPAVAEGEPEVADDPSFAAMLSQFRAKVTDQVDPEDAGDHYDLGLAFKEMGLIDEAIAEFQTALTAGTERLKVYEELGQCFVQKGQYNVALEVFNRALKVPGTEASDLLGVYYHLGQCHEELGQRAEARAAYEKVLAVDGSFADVPDRMARL